MKKIAINGFGRIGRLCYRALQHRKDLELVAINDLSDISTLAHLLKYDTAHGKFLAEVSNTMNSIVVDGKEIKAYMLKDAGLLPWRALGIDVVLECTGVNLNRESAQSHLQAGATKVILSAPPKDPSIPTFVLGVNDKELIASHTIISNASCTTNCLALIIKVLNENFGISFASMNTIHAFTQDQRLQDAPHKDLRRARAASLNIIPTTTGAAKAVEAVYAPIRGKLMASSYRVPIIAGSLIELVCKVDRPASIEDVNNAMKTASTGSYRGLLEYSQEPLVSSDIISNPHSAIFDSLLTESNGDMIKVVAWYDNEAGYAARLADICQKFAKI